MITSKTSIGIFIVFLIIGIIIYLLSSSKKTNPEPKPSLCAHCGNQKCDPVTGECLVDPILCNGVEKPVDKDGCNYICVREKEWLCEGSDKCKDSYLPSDIGSCTKKDLICEPNSKTLYCPKDAKCNGFDGYFLQDLSYTQCMCDPSHTGKQCQCTKSMCGDYGTVSVDDKGNCTCVCNVPAKFFGPKCNESCHIDGMINIDGNCKCDPAFYTQTGDICTPIPCVNGTKDKKGHCTCNNGFSASGPNGQCISACTVNQVWDEKANKCVCKPNTDFSGVDSPTNNGTQYSPSRDGKDCDVFHCHYASEFANGKCNCKDDSCGQNCQYTRQNVCNGNGNPNCAVNGGFINCTCDAGFYGEDCSCKGLPSGITDPSKLTDYCKGASTICKSGQWTTAYKDCDNIQLYFKNNGQDFQTQCFKENCEKDSASFYQNLGTLTCKNPSSDGQPSTFTCQGCPSTPNANCPSDHQVRICDASTNYNWVCKDQIHATGKCPPTPPSGSLCIDSNGTPDPSSLQCFQCGPNGGAEWICENQGSIPTLACLQNLEVESQPFSGYSGTGIFLKNSIPIYPTTDYDMCVPYIKDYNNISNMIPYYDGQISNINISSNLANPMGTINKQTKTFTSIAGNRYFDIIKGNSDGQCVLSDDDIMNYILKAPGQKLCSGNGSFKQETFSQNNTNYLKPTGHCECSTYNSKSDNSLNAYAGVNCQYDDNTTCGGVGTVTDDGECIPLNLIIAIETDTMPSGWIKCDGTNNTPDLRGRFIRGTDNDANVDKIGGSASHTLTVDEMPSHNHTIAMLNLNANVAYGDDISCVTRDEGNMQNYQTSNSKPFANMPFSIMPPFIVVNFIKRSNNSKNDSFPLGSIIWYYSKNNNIPDGWVMYDKSNKLLLGKSDIFKTNGGSSSVTLTIDNLPDHNHNYQYPYNGPGNNHCHQESDISCPTCDTPVSNINTGGSGSSSPSPLPFDISPVSIGLLSIKKVSETSVTYPSGSICAISGKINTIPKGWSVCNGSNSTPNLSDKFVVSSITSLSITGQSIVMLGPNNLPLHFHQSQYRQYPCGTNSCGSFWNAARHRDVASCTSILSYDTNVTDNVGKNVPIILLPPYYTLLYIMKL